MKPGTRVFIKESLPLHGFVGEIAAGSAGTVTTRRQTEDLVPVRFDLDRIEVYTPLKIILVVT
jgi:hypothetical protein